MRKKILVVDDEKDIVNFLEYFLKKNSIQVIKTTKGADATLLCALHKPDVVFLDINMPDKDGISVLKELKKLYPDLKVIMITAKTEREIFKKAKRYGAIEYITKPLDLKELIEKIRFYLS